MKIIQKNIIMNKITNYKKVKDLINNSISEDIFYKVGYGMTRPRPPSPRDK